MLLGKAIFEFLPKFLNAKVKTSQASQWQFIFMWGNYKKSIDVHLYRCYYTIVLKINAHRKRYNMKIKKMMDIRNGKKNFFLGRNKNGDKMWLVAPSWDCDWYWSIGHINIYQQNWILCSTHFDDVFPSYNSFIDEFDNTPFTENEKWEIYEYMKELYILRKYSDMMHNGGAHITTGSKTLQETEENYKEYNRINNILIPNVWKELEAILI